jgi:hypothetical protein
MIEERFLIAAINIRRVYMKLVSNLDSYEERAEDTLRMLDTAEKELNDVKNKKKSEESPDEMVKRIMKIFNDIENEGNKIEKFVEPLNKEIERLGIEERELYKRICDFHSTLSENQIVDIVQERLKKENLL